MGTIINFKTSLLFTALLSGLMSFAQVNHVLYLECDTDRITRNNLEDTCTFGQPQGVSNEDYTIYVNLGDTVTWRGVSLNSDIVSIRSINHRGGERLFNRNVLNGSGGVVQGVITQGRENDTEKYDIKFNVIKDGVSMPGIFIIDPKIKVMERSE